MSEEKKKKKYHLRKHEEENKAIIIRIPYSLFKSLRSMADSNNCSINVAIINVLKKHFGN